LRILLPAARFAYAQDPNLINNVRLFVIKWLKAQILFSRATISFFYNDVTVHNSHKNDTRRFVGQQSGRIGHFPLDSYGQIMQPPLDIPVKRMKIKLVK
jgi:hypothetical protein